MAGSRSPYASRRKLSSPWRSAAALAFLVSFAVACAPDDEPDPTPVVKPRVPPVCDPALAIGTGREAFAPLVDGDTVDLVKGATQGYFFTLSLQQRGIDPSATGVCYRGILVPEGVELGLQCWKAQFITRLDGGWYERLGLMAQVHPDFWNHPEELQGSEAILEVYVGDSNDCSITGEIRIRFATTE
jgi:hypothetical protein